jgi:hypothetical protein
MFENKSLLISTKHQKERVIAPIFEGLGFRCVLNYEFDTDELGTFSGEIERTMDPLNTLRAKCHLGLAKHDCDFAIATEGSFGAHPYIPFTAAHEEFIMLVDRNKTMEFVARSMTTTNKFQCKEILNVDDLMAFAQAVLFPTHAIIVKNQQEQFSFLRKGISNWDDLLSACNDCMNKYGSAFVETDLRAMNNPTRMKEIKLLAMKLLDKLKVNCPNCQFPGFDVVHVKPGLPCIACEFPTESTLTHEYGCQKCHFMEEKFYPNGKKVESQTFCPKCNP